MKSALKVILFVLVMGLVLGTLLLGMNLYTSPLIARNEEIKLKSSVLDVLDIPYDKANLSRIFDENVKSLERDGLTFYKAADGAVAFSLDGPGLWGPVSGIVSLEKDLKTIRSIKITHQEETPGLGGRIAEKEYLRQFRAKEILPSLVFAPEGKASRKNE